MSTISMNPKRSKIFDPYRLVINLTHKLDLGRGDQPAALSDLSIYYTCTKYKKSCGNNKFKLSET